MLPANLGGKASHTPGIFSDWNFIQARLQGKRTAEEDSLLAGAILTMAQKLWERENDASFLNERLVNL